MATIDRDGKLTSGDETRILRLSLIFIAQENLDGRVLLLKVKLFSSTTSRALATIYSLSAT
jgi:hypothetical protein